MAADNLLMQQQALIEWLRLSLISCLLFFKEKKKILWGGGLGRTRNLIPKLLVAAVLSSLGSAGSMGGDAMDKKGGRRINRVQGSRTH